MNIRFVSWYLLTSTDDIYSSSWQSGKYIGRGSADYLAIPTPRRKACDIFNMQTFFTEMESINF